jgi:hypothetical protein
MASVKSTLFHGTAGVLVAVVIIAGFVAGTYLLHPAKGKLTIEIMDKPVELQNLFVTIDGVQIKDDNDNWQDLPLTNANEESVFNFDLLTLQDVSETLSVAEVDEANYQMLWINVSSATAVYLDGTEDDLTVPSNIIKVSFKPYLQIDGGEEVTVLIDLQPDDLETIAISHSLNLRPVIKAIVPGTALELEP